ALKPIRGRDKVLRLILGLAAKSSGEPRFSFRLLNSLPALLVGDVRSITTNATRYTLHFEVDDAGRISGLHAVLTPRKLSALGCGFLPACISETNRKAAKPPRHLGDFASFR